MQCLNVPHLLMIFVLLLLCSTNTLSSPDVPRPKLTVARFPILDPCDQHWAWHLRSPLFIDGAQSVHFVSHTYYKHYLLLQMISLYMRFQIILIRSLIVTLITRVLDTFMFRLNVKGQTIISCCLIVTLITSILDSFML